MTMDEIDRGIQGWSERLRGWTRDYPLTALLVAFLLGSCT